MKRKLTDPSGVVVGFLLLGVLPALAQKADPADWAPADALVFVGVDDLKDLRSRLENTTSFALFNDPLAKEVDEQIKLVHTVTEQFTERLAKLMNVPAERVTSPFGGALAFYLQATGDKESPVHFAAVCGVADKSLMQEYYDKIVAHLKGAADQHEMTDFASQQIATFKRTRAAEAHEGFDPEALMSGGAAMMDVIEKGLDHLFSADAVPPSLALCLANDRLIVADTAEVVQDVLREQRRAGTLKETPDYRTLVKKFEPLGSIRFLINTPRLFELAQADMDDEGRKWFNIFGFRAVKSAIGHIAVNGEEYNYRFEGLLLMDEQRSGLPKILTMANREVAPPASVPADALMCASVNVDPSAVLDEVERMIRQSDENMANQFSQGLSVETPDGKIDLRKQLFGNLRGPLAFSLQVARPYAVDSFRLLISIAHRDREAMERLLAQVAGMAQGMVTTRDLAGKQVLDMGMVGMSLAAGADTIYLGSTPMVETSLQSASGDRLADDAVFRRAARLAPREAFALVYADARRLMEAGIELSKHVEAMQREMFNPAAQMGASMVGALGGIEPDKLEQARKLLKYYGQSLSTVSAVPEGIAYMQVDLKPKSD